MKICVKCLTEKNESEFYKKGKKRQNDCQSYCKPCFNDYCMQRWLDRKDKAIELMGNKCFDCGLSWHRNVYDFHHVEKKDFDWKKLRLRSWDSIVKELSKCVMLCANCHRIRHIHLS